MKPKNRPRNSLVVTAKFRKAGAHEKSNKAKRRAAAVAFKRQMKEQAEGRDKHIPRVCPCLVVQQESSWLIAELTGSQ